MQKEVRYGGLATNPSDYDCADGQLAAAVGLVNEDGAMRNVWQPAVVGADLSGRKILFLHAATGYRHYILFKEPTIGVSPASSSVHEILQATILE